MPFEIPTNLVLSIDAANQAVTNQAKRLMAGQEALDLAKQHLDEDATFMQELFRQRRCLTQLAFIERGLDEDVLELRRHLEEELAVIGDRSVTYGEHELAVARYRSYQRKLVDECPHGFLYYEPSQYIYLRGLTRHKERVPGYFVCLVCGFKETQHGRDSEGNELYKTLADGERMSVIDLGDLTEPTDMSPPIPWEKIRRLFLSRELREAARRANYDLK